MLQLDSNIRLGGLERVYVPEEGIFIQREITDKDGDGVEDNVYYKHHELDKFYKPAVFRTAEEMHNTRNDELPGHHLKEDHPVPGRHASDIIKGSEAEEKAHLKEQAAEARVALGRAANSGATAEEQATLKPEPEAAEEKKEEAKAPAAEEKKEAAPAKEEKKAEAPAKEEKKADAPAAKKEEKPAAEAKPKDAAKLQLTENNAIFLRGRPYNGPEENQVISPTDLTRAEKPVFGDTV